MDGYLVREALDLRAAMTNPRSKAKGNHELLSSLFTHMNYRLNKRHNWALNCKNAWKNF